MGKARSAYSTPGKQGKHDTYNCIGSIMKLGF